VVLIGFIWLRIGTSGGLYRTFGFNWKVLELLEYTGDFSWRTAHHGELVSIAGT
jgi:hypothetical protein